MDGRRGIEDLPTLLDICQPLDWFVVMLGTNDTKSHLNAAPEIISSGLGQILDRVQSHPYGVGQTPRILAIAPAVCTLPIDDCPFAGFDDAAARKSRDIIPLFRQVAQAHGALFLDANEVAQAGADRIHLTRESHLALAGAVADLLRKQA